MGPADLHFGAGHQIEDQAGFPCHGRQVGEGRVRCVRPAAILTGRQPHAAFEIQCAGRVQSRRNTAGAGQADPGLDVDRRPLRDHRAMRREHGGAGPCRRTVLGTLGKHTAKLLSQDLRTPINDGRSRGSHQGQFVESLVPRGVVGGKHHGDALPGAARTGNGLAQHRTQSVLQGHKIPEGNADSPRVVGTGNGGRPSQVGQPFLVRAGPGLGFGYRCVQPVEMGLDHVMQ